MGLRRHCQRLNHVRERQRHAADRRPNGAGQLLTGTTISGFTRSDTIDLTAIAHDAGYDIGVNGANGMQFSDNGTTHDMQLAGNHSGLAFYISPADAGTGSDITAVARYCRGTPNLTGRGKLPVKGIGDR